MASRGNSRDNCKIVLAGAITIVTTVNCNGIVQYIAESRPELIIHFTLPIIPFS